MVSPNNREVFEVGIKIARSRLSVNGREVSYITYGSGQQHVILINGFGLNALSWLPFTLPLASQATFYAVDLPGHGHSYEVPPNNPDDFLLDYVDCISQMVRTLNGKPYHLIAFSLGAYACLRFLLETELDLPIKYMHIDHTPFPKKEINWNGQMDSTLFNLFGELDTMIRAESLDLLKTDFSHLPLHVLHKFYETIDTLDQLVVSNLAVRSVYSWAHKFPILGPKIRQRVAWPWAMSIIRGYYSSSMDLRPKLKDLSVPTLLLVGGENKLFSPGGMYFMNLQMPNSKLVEFKHTNHDLHFAHPIRFISILNRFLKADSI
jgi:pimeloyl-ACP methyl ester carboxylesterase